MADTPKPNGTGKELGASGTLITNGILTGEEYNNKLRGKNGLKIYDTMRRSDATVKSTLLVCKLPLMSASYEVQPAADDDEEQFRARFIKRELMERNVNWSDFLRESTTMFDFGFSVVEKVFEVTEFETRTMIGIKKLGFRKQTSINKWETSDGKPGIEQQLVAETASIPMDKLIVFTHDKEGDNYEGTPLLRPAYKHWDIKDKLDLVNAVAIEKMAIGVPILKKPPDADPAELAVARDAMRSFRGNEQGFQEMPDGWTVEMLDMKSNSVKDALPTIQYHDRQIQLTVLAQFLSLGGVEGASGSRAVSTDQSSLFLKALEAAANNIVSTLQNQLIKQICDLNFTDMPNGYPKLTFGSLSDDNLAELSEAVTKLVTAGAVTPDIELEKSLRRTFRLPEVSKEIEEKYATADDTVVEKKAVATPDKTTADKVAKDNDIEKEEKKNVEASFISDSKAYRASLVKRLM